MTAFAAAADPVLEQAPAPVAHLGIDEHRRGRPRWRIDADTGEYLLLADRWHTCFFDLSGDQGLLGQVEGRTADDAAYWLAQAAPAWRDAVRVVAIDMCSIYASAVRRMLPGAQIAVDLFHVVHLAVKMTGDVRRRVVRGKYGRRGRSGDPEYGIKNLLVRNLEHLSPAQFAKVTGTLQADPGGQEIAAAWIGKEKLRHALNLRARVTGSVPCERNVRDRLFAFYDWCACNDDIPELLSLARTISRWEDQIVCAVLTGVTNATSESLNRLAKLEARLAYGFRNPANQRRRVRIACTRGTTTPITHRNRQENTPGNRPETPSRLSSKSRISSRRSGRSTRFPDPRQAPRLTGRASAHSGMLSSVRPRTTLTSTRVRSFFGMEVPPWRTKWPAMARHPVPCGGHQPSHDHAPFPIPGHGDQIAFQRSANS